MKFLFVENRIYCSIIVCKEIIVQRTFLKNRCICKGRSSPIHFTTLFILNEKHFQGNTFNESNCASKPDMPHNMPKSSKNQFIFISPEFPFLSATRLAFDIFSRKTLSWLTTIIAQSKEESAFSKAVTLVMSM